MQRSYLFVVLVVLGALAATPAFAYDTGTGPTPTGYSCADCHSAVWGKGPHGGYSDTTQKCAACHSVHAAGGTLALTWEDTFTDVCYACHDGTGGLGVYGTIQMRTGAAPGAKHRIDTTGVIPGGSAGGGSRTVTFQGVGDTLTCGDCHTPHDGKTVAPFVGERKRGNTYEVYATTKLLRQQTTGSATGTPVYGSDWCAGCHLGRKSGGAAHTHPVDSAATSADPFDYSSVPSIGYMASIGVTVDSSGNVYVCDPGNYRVQKFTSAGVHALTFTDADRTTGILKPTDVAVDGSGSVYIADVGLSTVSQWTAGGAMTAWRPFSDSPVAPKNYPGTAYVEYPAGATGATAGSMWGGVWGPGWGADLSSPVRPYFLGMAAVNAGSKYLSDGISDQIWVLDSVGSVVAKWGGPGSGNGQFNQPSAIARDGAGNLYIADTGNHRIQVLSSAGAYVRQWGTNGSSDGQFAHPAGIAVDTVNGWVYVLDTGNARVQKFTLTGTYLGQFGTYGTGNGQFALPYNATSERPMVTRTVPGVDSFRDYMVQSAYVMPYPRSTEQLGRGPICQQCHEDSRSVGAAAGGGVMVELANIAQDGDPAGVRPWSTAANPQFQNFPHETQNAGMVVERADDLCMNCHPTGQLP